MKDKMTKNPLITISIPTLNSGAFLERCIRAIKNQTYNIIEVNIIDGGSTDTTLEIAKKYHIPSYHYPYALLGARNEGLLHAKGEYILLLDSDQILLPNALKNALEEIKNGYDMLILEEGVYEEKTIIEKLFAADRRLISTVKNFDPDTGVMLPRFYKTSLLEKTFSSIPQTIQKNVGGQDHAIIYYEAWKKSKKVGYVKNAVVHIEPNSLRKIWKKFYRWGYTSIDAHYGKYDSMLRKKERFRTGLFKNGLILESFASILLLLLKGVPYKTGYFMASYHK